jgi:hypothetical protein
MNREVHVRFSEGLVVRLHWATRPLKRVFGIEIDRCEQCGGELTIIASIENPEVIGQILEHLCAQSTAARRLRALASRTADRR